MPKAFIWILQLFLSLYPEYAVDSKSQACHVKFTCKASFSAEVGPILRFSVFSTDSWVNIRDVSESDNAGKTFWARSKVSSAKELFNEAISTMFCSFAEDNEGKDPWRIPPVLFSIECKDWIHLQSEKTKKSVNYLRVHFIMGIYYVMGYTLKKLKILPMRYSLLHSRPLCHHTTLLLANKSIVWCDDTKNNCVAD